jgi:DTW domain-containing protein YfiP
MNNKRACCPRCARPMRTCLCQWIVTTANHTELIILQHPLEVNNAKNSARLLQLSLGNCRVYEGETFTDDFLHNLILADDKKALLLFPQTPDAPSQQFTPADSTPAHCAQQRLIMLDGTWRKCRKMLYLNPILQQLPRLSLDHCPPSRYHIRKAHADNQLSTLEASCYALQQLENNAVDYHPLLTAFDGFVAQQLALIPPQQ